jgi:hypothetical protein
MKWIILPALLAATASAGAQPPGPPPGAPLSTAGPLGQVTAIAVGERLARFDNLTPGTRTYLRYRVLNDVWRPVDIWRREVRFDDQGGQRRLHIVQSWTGPTGAISNLDIDSWFEMGTFAPISHERRNVRAEEVRNEGFRFTPSRIDALPATPNNVRASFTLDTPRRPFNFETDMEMLQTLPLAEGYAVRLPFYHPGGSPPSDWVFRVIGSDRLNLATGPADVWVVEMIPAEGPPVIGGRFFVAKRGQQVLRVEQPMPGGGMIVKVLIDSSAPAA